MSTTESALGPESEDAGDQEQEVTPLELFFDLVFVFAMTQVTGFLAHHVTWSGMVRGVALLAALWWAWVCYSWLTNAVPAEALLARPMILAAMAAMLIVALAVPTAFGDTGVIFGIAYFVVRALHVALYAISTGPETQQAILRLAPGFLVGPVLLVVAGFLNAPLQAVFWVAALAIDYGVAFVRGVAGFSIHPEHFVERHRLIVIIALGESIIGIGTGVGTGGLTLSPFVILAALIGIILIIALWWLYFDYVVLAAERNLIATSGSERAALARDSYSYLHLPMIAGIIFIALGLKKTLAHVTEPLGVIPAVALCGGGAVYLLGHNAFRLRDTGTVSIPLLLVTVIAAILVFVALRTSALIALAALAILFVGLATYETFRAESRQQLRGD